MSEVLWTSQTASYNTTEAESDNAIVVGSDGSSYVVYTTYGDTSGNTRSSVNADIAVVKFNAAGVTQWVTQQISFNTLGYNGSPCIGVDGSGNTYIAYGGDAQVSGGTLTGTNDIIVFKLNASGQNVWTVQSPTINSNDSNFYPSIAVDTSGNSYIAYNSINGSDQTVSVAKMDTDGTVVWVKNDASFNISPDTANSPNIGVDGSGNSYVVYYGPGTASGQTNSGGDDIIVFKLNTNGDTQWITQQPSFNTSEYDQNPVIAVDASGNSVVAYTTTGTASGGTNSGSNDVVVFKLNTNGQTLWTVENPILNTVEYDGYPSIATNGSNICVTYTTSGTISGGVFTSSYYDIVVYKLNSSGQIVWTAQNSVFNTSDGTQYSAVSMDPSGNAYVTYNSNGTVSGGTNTGSTDIILFKIGDQQPPCFNYGTQILCVDKDCKEVYVPIQDIKVGTIVKTYYRGNRRVTMCGHKTMINNPEKWAYSMYKMPKTGEMLDDLIVTGGHSILQDKPVTDVMELTKQHKYWGNKKYLIDGKYMVLAAVSKKFTQLKDTNQYTYYHLVLDCDNEYKQYGIWANGVLTESQSLHDFKKHKYDGFDLYTS